MDVNEYNKRLYRQKHLRRLKDDELLEKVWKAYHWLSENDGSDNKRYTVAEMAYYAIIDELKSRGIEEPDYENVFDNSDMVEEVFQDLIDEENNNNRGDTKSPNAGNGSKPRQSTGPDDNEGHRLL